MRRPMAMETPFAANIVKPCQPAARTHTHTLIHTQIHTRTRTRTHAHTHTHTYRRTHADRDTHTQTHTHTHLLVRGRSSACSAATCASNWSRSSLARVIISRKLGVTPSGRYNSSGGRKNVSAHVAQVWRVTMMRGVCVGDKSVSAWERERHCADARPARTHVACTKARSYQPQCQLLLCLPQTAPHLLLFPRAHLSEGRVGRQQRLLALQRHQLRSDERRRVVVQLLQVAEPLQSRVRALVKQRHEATQPPVVQQRLPAAEAEQATETDGHNSMCVRRRKRWSGKNQEA